MPVLSCLESYSSSWNRQRIFSMASPKSRSPNIQTCELLKKQPLRTLLHFWDVSYQLLHMGTCWSMGKLEE